MSMRGFALGILVFVPLILAHVLGPEKFGSYSLALSVIYFLTAISSSASSSGLVVYSNKEFSASGKMNRSVSAWLTITACAVSFSLIVSLIFIKPITQFASITYFEFIFLMLAYLGLVSKGMFQGLLFAMNKRFTSVFFEMLTNAFSVLFVLGLLAFSLVRLNLIFLVFLIPTLIAALFLLKQIDFHHMKPFLIDKQRVAELIHFTKWTTLTVLAVQLIGLADNLVLRLFVPLADIGIFNLGFQVFKGSTMVTNTINMYFSPWAARNVHDKVKVRQFLYNKRVKIMAMIGTGLTVTYFVLPLFFDILYGKAYAGSAAAAQVLLFATFFTVYSVMHQPFFYAVDEFRYFQITRVVMLSTNVLLDLVMIPHYGYMGSAYATVISSFLGTLSTEIYFHKRVKRRLFND